MWRGRSWSLRPWGARGRQGVSARGGERWPGCDGERRGAARVRGCAGHNVQHRDRAVDGRGRPDAHRSCRASIRAPGVYRPTPNRGQTAWCRGIRLCPARAHASGSVAIARSRCHSMAPEDRRTARSTRSTPVVAHQSSIACVWSAAIIVVPRALALHRAQRGPVDPHGVTPMAQAAQEGLDQRRIAEQARPFGIVKVRGDNRRPPQIAFFHQLCLGG